MNSNIGFDELFAVRVSLQDTFEAESDIIRELKYDLLESGMPSQNIPNYLKEFYEHFGINITIEQINEILNTEPLTQNNLINVLQNLLNTHYNPLPINNDSSNNDATGVNEEEESVHEEETSEENEGDEPETNTNDNIYNDMPPLIPVNQLQQYTFTMAYNPAGQFQIITNNNVPYQMPPMTLQPLLSSLFTNLQIPPIPHMEDVITTLDESDADKLKKYKLDSKKEEKCSICMTDMDKDQEVCDLPCSHTFHDDCIQPWLTQYNYKCPICRKEVGKPKHNI
jgi:hypothetical protein